MINKFADLIEVTPYRMGTSAAALRKWISGTIPHTLTALPLLMKATRAAAVPLGDAAGARHIQRDGAMAFEPAVCDVFVARDGPVHAAAPAMSQRASFVYGMARSMVIAHRMSWPEALQTAERCWLHLRDKYKPFIDGARRPGPEGDAPAAPRVADVDDASPVELDMVAPGLEL